MLDLHDPRLAACCWCFRFAHPFASGTCQMGEMNGEETSESEISSWFRWGYLHC